MASTNQGPRRIGQWLYLRPECIDEYKKCHAAVWPEVLEQIKDSNVRDCMTLLLPKIIFHLLLDTIEHALISRWVSSEVYSTTLVAVGSTHASISLPPYTRLTCGRQTVSSFPLPRAQRSLRVSNISATPLTRTWHAWLQTQKCRNGKT